MLTKPAAILFDMGGVLLESADKWDADDFRKSFPNGLPEPAQEDWFLGMSADIMARFQAIPPPRHAVNWRPVIEEWLCNRGIEPSPGVIEYWYGMVAQWEVRPVFDFVKPTLEALRVRGFRLGLISNTLMEGARLKRHLVQAGIGALFECMVFSGDVGPHKPDPAIFRNALNRMGIEPARAWYVGDKPERDVCGAHGVGMTAVLVDSAHAHHSHDAPENVPDLRIPNISVLTETLEQLSDCESGEPAGCVMKIKHGGPKYGAQAT